MHPQISLFKSIVITNFCLFVLFADAFSSAFVPRSSSLISVLYSSSGMTMKIFDWKRRTADESAINDLETMVFTLDNLKPAPGSRQLRTRKGRGIAAGQGATCGFGMRGQKSRGGNPTRPGFEGGQTPLYRRLPKFVGKPTGPGHTKTIYNVLSTDELMNLPADSTAVFTPKSKYKLYKMVLGKNTGSIPANLSVQAHAFTQTARAAIEAANGKCEILSKTTNQVVVDEE